MLVQVWPLQLLQDLGSSQGNSLAVSACESLQWPLVTSARQSHVLHLLWKLVGSHSRQQEIQIIVYSCLNHPMKHIHAAEAVTPLV